MPRLEEVDPDDAFSSVPYEKVRMRERKRSEREREKGARGRERSEREREKAARERERMERMPAEEDPSVCRSHVDVQRCAPK